jgi:predicted nucleotidyltransferase component of viral defense system
VPEATSFRRHEDPDLFREAVSFTAAETGFPPRLIEKDYFSTVLLQHLETTGAALVFKGGTCLAKVHIGFYRLSEDLDFAVPMPVDATRSERRARASGLKDALLQLSAGVPGVRFVEGLKGASASTQYSAVVGYGSLVARQEETIRLEVALREPLLAPSIRGAAATLLLDPISGTPWTPLVPVTCVSLEEAMAEKLRAAFSRREVAIRDFYDLDHVARRSILDLNEAALLELVRRKLRVPGNEPVDVSSTRLATLRPQLEAQLRPVLRARDYAEFDLERAAATVRRVAAALELLDALPRPPRMRG